MTETWEDRRVRISSEDRTAEVRAREGEAIDARIRDAFRTQVGFDLAQHCVVMARVGSHSHGTYVPPTDPDAIDDVDYMGFVVPPIEYHLGLKRFEHWTLKQDELDVVLYSLEKAVRLLLKSNPNIIGMLWLRPEDYVLRSLEFNYLRGSREAFSSKQVASSFMGYASAQLAKMESFDLEKMERYEQLIELCKPVTPEELVNADRERMAHLDREHPDRRAAFQEFRHLHRACFSGYMGHKRKTLVRRYGFDVKNCAHMIRLLRTCAEYLESGEMRVYREGAEGEIVRQIKRGEWSLGRAKAHADELFERINGARDASPLPEDPDAERAGRLLVQAHKMRLGL